MINEVTLYHKEWLCGFVVMSAMASNLLCVIVVVATSTLLISPTFGLSDCEDQGESKLDS